MKKLFETKNESIPNHFQNTERWIREFIQNGAKSKLWWKCWKNTIQQRTNRNSKERPIIFCWTKLGLVFNDYFVRNFRCFICGFLNFFNENQQNTSWQSKALMEMFQTMPVQQWMTGINNDIALFFYWTKVFDSI